MSSELLTHQFFAPLVGTVFHVAVDGEAVDVRLAEVIPLPPLRRADAGDATPTTESATRGEPFTLRFDGPLNRPLPQRTYRMTQESVPDPLDIFIVPIARERDGFVYQAVFA